MCQAGGHLFQINLFIFLVWLPQRGIDGAIYLRKNRAGVEREREGSSVSIPGSGWCRLVLQLASPFPLLSHRNPHRQAGSDRKLIGQLKKKLREVQAKLTGLHLRLDFKCAPQMGRNLLNI